ncbi:hypothetical protein [Curvibacter lanceolatus]|uniref:hypothetical protein n=1 Tax=Curvibacter lanceolatus TaxID=86182 RepID=UPI0003706DB0|nr:hypothetical protein [Curvibacter lanceolatus]
MLTTIKAFRHGEHRYRHVINTKTDDVFLQLERHDEPCETLLRYDLDGNAWDMAGEYIGKFRMRGGFWVFEPPLPTLLTNEPIPQDTAFILCERTSAAESLLDSEVTISKRWLDSQ